MAVNLSPVGGVAAQFFDNSGYPLTGGKLYSYAAGTTTPATTYTSSNGATAHSNPIVLDAAGRVPAGGEIWLTDGVIYKFVLKTSTDTLIATYDNITGINSNAVAYTNSQDIQTATAGQTVFTLPFSYQAGTNSLSVFVDGVNQYGPGAQYSYVETDSSTVTFNDGLHVGAEVKFTTTQQQGAGAVDAAQVSYVPPFTGGVATNVEDKLAQTVSVLDFGADPTGVADSTSAFQDAVDSYNTVHVPPGTYNITTVNVSMKGAEIVMDEKAYLNVTGNGIYREITQLSRSAYLTAQGGLAAALAAIDGYNLYDTLRVTGGNIIVGANATGVSNRIPFLQYIGVAPAPTEPGLQPFKAAMEVSNVSFILSDSTSLGIGIRGGWGTTVSDCSFSGYDAGLAININADGTYNASSQPQTITITNNNFNSCSPISANKGTCTNSCEALSILGNKFNFVQTLGIQDANVGMFYNNYFVVNDRSAQFIDCTDWTISQNYFQAAQPPLDSTHNNVVYIQNASNMTFVSNNILINAGANRSGVLFKGNNSNDVTNVVVRDIVVMQGTQGGSGVSFSSGIAPYIFDGVFIDNVYTQRCDNILNTVDGIAGTQKNFSISNLTHLESDACINYIYGFSRLDTATLNAPQYYQNISLDLLATANNAGAIAQTLRYTIQPTVTSANFTVAISNFVNTSNCDSITAAKTNQSVAIKLLQSAAAATSAVVSGTATLEIYGSAV